MSRKLVKPVIIIAIAVVLLTAFFGFQESFALTCSGPTMDDEFDSVDVVFTGKIIAKEYLPTNDDRPLEKYAISTMQVDEIFKGSLNDTVKIKTDEGYSGIYLAEDWRYVIFGKISDDIVKVTSCTNSGHIPPILSSENIFTEDAEPRMNQLKALLSERDISFTEKNMSLEEKREYTLEEALEIQRQRTGMDEPVPGPEPEYPRELTAEDVQCMRKMALVEGKDIAPKWQIFCGTPPDEIRCNEGLQLIYKSTDNSPACVKPQTAEKLIQRGWAFDVSSINSFEACVAAGISVMNEQDEEGGWWQHCYTPDGKKFIVDCNKPFNSCI